MIKDNKNNLILNFEIIFENCEYIDLPSIYVKDFDINYLQRDSSKDFTFDEGTLIIDRQARNYYVQMTDYFYTEKVFDRILRCNDITSIKIQPFNYKIKHITDVRTFYPQWNHMYEFNNEHQKSYINWYGDLVVKWK